MKTNLIIAAMAAHLCFASAHLFAAVTISVSDVTIAEGDVARFVITLSQKSSQKITIEYETRDGSACANCDHPDYVRLSSTATFGTFPLEFQPGQLSTTLDVTTRNDTCLEGTQTFFLDVKNPTGHATIAKGTGTCTIIDNDGPTLCCCQQIFGICLSRSTCCCGGAGEGIPVEASIPVGVPISYGILWTVPPPEVWRSLKTMDIRLVGEDGVAILTIRWDEETNSFSLLNPGNDEFQQTDVPDSPGRFESSAVALLLENSEVIGSGPDGLFVLLNLNLIFKPLAAGHNFHVEARITNDAGIEKGYDPVGTIAVQSR